MKPRFLKELELVFAAGLGGRDTTLLLDDDEYKACRRTANTRALSDPQQASRNPPHTALHPPAFTAEQLETDDALGEQGALRCYLEFLANAESVPSFVAANVLALQN